MIDPRQNAFAGFAVALFYEAVDEIVRQTIGFDNDKSPGLGKRSRREERYQNKRKPQITQIVLMNLCNLWMKEPQVGDSFKV